MLVKSTIFIVSISNFGIVYFKCYIFILCGKIFHLIGTLKFSNLKSSFFVNPQLLLSKKYSNQLQRKLESTLQEMKVIQEKLGKLNVYFVLGMCVGMLGSWSVCLSLDQAVLV